MPYLELVIYQSSGFLSLSAITGCEKLSKQNALIQVRWPALKQVNCERVHSLLENEWANQDSTTHAPCILMPKHMHKQVRCAARCDVTPQLTEISSDCTPPRKQGGNIICMVFSTTTVAHFNWTPATPWWCRSSVNPGRNSSCAFTRDENDRRNPASGLLSEQPAYIYGTGGTCMWARRYDTRRH